MDRSRTKTKQKCFTPYFINPMSQKRYLCVKNFDALQMYKDRNPIWIKLYCSILDDYEFAQIPDETKFHAVGLMLLASRLNNKFPEDEPWLRQKINANSEINLKLLLEIGFLDVIKGSRSNEKKSFNGCKSLKRNGKSVTQNKNLRSVEQNTTEENITEHNTTEHGEASGVECVPVDFGLGISDFGLENGKSTNQISKTEDQKSKVKDQRSIFSIDECFRYVEICQTKGEDVKNAKGLANHIYKTGEADSFIQAALYPEKLAEVEKIRYGEPRQFSDEPCKVCFGAKMADVGGKGFRKCEHCRDEKGKAIGLEPIGEKDNEQTIYVANHA